MNWLLKAKLPHIGDKSWLTLGPYLRKSTLKTLADYVEKDGLLHVAANLGFTDEADDAATGFNKEIGLEIQVRITRENRIAKGRADPNYSDSSDSETESLSDSKAESLSDSDSE